jgi:hypothetical protein
MIMWQAFEVANYRLLLFEFLHRLSAIDLLPAVRTCSTMSAAQVESDHGSNLTGM